ncbi:hypothetical protein M3Y99_01666400 [Aphelenchoides fujianensis]|nr:hypothetical protein M3Y99_01666400 [Aphelenchoides fujianensis]
MSLQLACGFEELKSLLLSACNLRELALCFQLKRLDFEFVHHWLDISNILCGHPALTDLHVDVRELSVDEMRFVIQLLPEKITSARCDWAMELPAVLLDRKTLLRKVEVHTFGRSGALLTDCFRLKAEELEFTIGFVLEIGDFAECGSLEPNGHLRKITLTIPNRETFRPLAHYKRDFAASTTAAFARFRSLNDRLRVRVRLCRGFYKIPRETLVDRVEEKLDAVRILVDCARQAGFVVDEAGDPLSVECHFDFASKLLRTFKRSSLYKQLLIGSKPIDNDEGARAFCFDYRDARIALQITTTSV